MHDLRNSNTEHQADRLALVFSPSPPVANTTVRGALSIHGTNPQYLIEKVIRSRIYDSPYWKEHCFALNAASLIDRALSIKYIGGTYANQKPTEFMCLVLKLLQLQPEREIILEYLRAEEFKYLRALAAFYVRLTFDPLNAYETLEPLLDDYRKLRVRAMGATSSQTPPSEHQANPRSPLDGSYSLTTIDAFADSLLSEERVCEIQLPRLTQRKVLEEIEGLSKRKSKLGKALGVLGKSSKGDGADGSGDEDEEDEDDERGERYMSRSPSRSLSPEVEGGEGEDGERDFWTEGSEDESEKEGSQGRYISRSPSVERYVSRSPSPNGSPKPETVMGMEVDTERIDGDV